MKRAKSASFSTNEEIDKLLAELTARTTIGRSGLLKLAITEYAERHRPGYRPTPGQTALVLMICRYFKATPDGRTLEERFFALTGKYEKMMPSSKAEP